ncbi:MAG TPA: 50S ribosomal protein L32e [Candidatus Thermoplasmatota archaeon]|nr:50S ribosomal protein L32e [Candidatus Thermoplasmatota archaeon]
MAGKEEFIEKVSKLPGVGPKTAEKLYDAGYDSVEKLQAATADELVEKGIGRKTAEAIVKGLATPEGAKGEIEVVEAPRKEEAAVEKPKKAKREEKVEVVEAEAAYAPKIKAQLSEEVVKTLAIRAIRKATEPGFKKYHWFRYKKLDDAWRRPRGGLNKQRRGFNYRPPRVKIGYASPVLTRGLHPSGFAEVLVHNPDELAKIDPKTQAARIGGTVGGRKRKLIESAAAEKGIRVLNPRRT